MLVAGIVDSGADRTLLPKSLAANLGISDTDLVPTPHGSGGAGNTSFSTWTSTRVLTGQIVAILPGGPQLWGPTFALAPEYAENTTPLFG